MNDALNDATRSKYEQIDAQLALEERKRAMRADIDRLQQRETELRLETEDVKRRLRALKAEFASADTDFRAGRRAAAARAQQEALALGQKTYNTGTQCRNGHFSPRYTSSGACVMCDKIGWESGRLRTAQRHDEPDEQTRVDES